METTGYVNDSYFTEISDYTDEPGVIYINDVGSVQEDSGENTNVDEFDDNEVVWVWSDEEYDVSFFESDEPEEVIEDLPDVIYEDEDGRIFETEEEIGTGIFYEGETETILADDPERIPIGQGLAIVTTEEEYIDSFFSEKSREPPPYKASEYEVTLLAKLIHHEAGNQPRAGKVAVGEVVMNRIYSSKFRQTTITDIVYAPGQFAGNEEIWRMRPSNEEYEIAQGVIDGTERIFNDPNVCFFKNPTITSSGAYDADDVVDWGKYEWCGWIGGHAFYRLVPT